MLMALLARLPRARPYICKKCLQSQRGRHAPRRFQSTTREPLPEWQTQARNVRNGTQQSMLDILAERGLVKDVAGGQEALDWLLTEKPIGAYVGVDPTAPSMHVGHLLPMMTLFWLYLHGYPSVLLLGSGTVEIGDPSGRTAARKRQADEERRLNVTSMHRQLGQLWRNVVALGVKHKFPTDLPRKRDLWSNSQWFKNLTAIELLRDLGSGMRLGTMLNRDSVKLRMESGEGMAISEFSYPLFQAFDWWTMYNNEGVQLQIGGSDQYGNICAGMDAIDHMRKLKYGPVEEDTRNEPFGLTTPLLTTASGEKFGKSAGNAVWIDKDMLSSFDLYQYFLRTADADVERYLKLFTFLPISHIHLVMGHQQHDPSKRSAQHLLAKEVVELVHGAAAATRAETAHRDAFRSGTSSFSLIVLRNILHPEKLKPAETARQESDDVGQELLAYKKAYIASSPSTVTSADPTKQLAQNITILPKSLVRNGQFSKILLAAGLADSRSKAHQLIQNGGAYVASPNPGQGKQSNELKWFAIPKKEGAVNPADFLVDWEALVLRVGKAKIQICKVVEDAEFAKQGLSCPGWGDVSADTVTDSEGDRSC